MMKQKRFADLVSLLAFLVMVLEHVKMYNIISIPLSLFSQLLLVLGLDIKKNPSVRVIP
jgi:hypothetical protein